MRRLRTRWIAAITIAAGLMLTGCGAQMTDDDTFEQAWQLNSTFKAAVADVQVQILDAPWQVDLYGSGPESCEGKPDHHRYQMVRTTPADWRIGADPLTAAKGIAAWLEDNGWEQVHIRTYTDSVDDVLIEARNTEANVDLLTVDYSPGEAFDGVDITAWSTCAPGRGYDIWRMQMPLGDPHSAVERAELPTVESPAAPQSFGWDDTGALRYP